MQTFQPGDLKTDQTFKRAVAVSIAIHIAVVSFFAVKSLIKPKPALKKNLYLFEMVEPPSQPYHFTAPEPVKTAPEPIKEKKAKAIKTEKKAKALSSKKQAKKEMVKPEANPEPQTESAPEEVSKEGAESTESGVTIAKPGFPFSYYEQQIFSAIYRNWQLTPVELLGTEVQMAVTVKFDILKSGATENVSIAESSWNSILDGLALRAVEKAKIPPIPGEDQTLTVACRLVLKRK